MADTASPPPQPPPELTPREVAWMVGALPPGSVVAVRGADFDGGALAGFAGELARVSGHLQFVVVDLPADAKLDVVHDPEAVANLLGLVRPSPPGFRIPPELPLDQHHSTVPPPERAAWLLRNVRQRGDEFGDVANATGAELRDALVLAAAALNAAQAPDVTPEASTVAFLAAGAVAPAVPDLVDRLAASLAAARDYLAEHPDSERAISGLSQVELHGPPPEADQRPGRWDDLPGPVRAAD